uniref:Calreticulin n=1 Tax=Esox lucius TaxID=8010 RepID=A0A3P8Z6K1_ESOLU
AYNSIYLFNSYIQNYYVQLSYVTLFLYVLYIFNDSFKRWLQEKGVPEPEVAVRGRKIGYNVKPVLFPSGPKPARMPFSSACFEPFSHLGKTLVIQFTVKHGQNIVCGGRYIKLFPADLNQADMHGDSNYNIINNLVLPSPGPDICGPGTKKIHVVINYKGKSYLIRQGHWMQGTDDEYSHMYTLILYSDNTYVESKSLEEDWDILPPKKIKDSEAMKERVEDPDDKKPEYWDKPENIADPDPPMISNPDYKGDWKPLNNPNYKGKWVHPKIANPDYSADSEICRFNSIGVIGLDLWQVKSGTIFDNFLITDDATLAEGVGNETWGQTKDPEKNMKEEQERMKLEDELEEDEDTGVEGEEEFDSIKDELEDSQTVSLGQQCLSGWRGLFLPTSQVTR